MDYRFSEWATPSGASASAIFQERTGSGVYILLFANAEAYVGQSVNLPARFASHRRRWNDIVAVRFTPVPLQDLDETERAIIGQQVRNGVRLRNLTLLHQPHGPSPLDLVVDREYQQAWLAETDVEDVIQIDEDRFNVAQRRIASRAKLDQLKSHPRYRDVLDSVAAYVELAIPWPDQTEGRVWTLTALPSTSRRRNNRRLATLSIQNVEMLYLAESCEADGPWRGYTVFNIALTPRIPDEIATRGRRHGGYRSAGDVFRFDLEGCSVIPELLEDPQVRRAARQLALGQLRKGRGIFQRFHNDAFTDEVFAHIHGHRIIERR